VLKSAIRYPIQDNWVSRLLVGGLLTATSIILLPMFTLLGYSLRILEDSVDGYPDPPEFEDYISITKHGFIVSVISIVYLLSPIIISLLAISGLVRINEVYEFSMPVFSIIGVSLLLPATTVSAAMYYIAPAAIIRYALERRIMSAFELSEINNIILTKTYATGTIPPVLVGISSLLLVAISITSTIGAVVAPFIQFYIQVVMLRMFAIAYRKSMDTPTVDRYDLLEMAKIKSYKSS